MNIPPIKLNNGRMIGIGYPAYIIAEIGSNHDGDLERAKDLILAAKMAGADAAKFQSFQVENLINHSSKHGNGWKQDPAWEILKRLSVPLSWHKELQHYAKEQKIDFISTPFDCDRLNYLVELDVPIIKIASGDLTYFDLLRLAGKAQKPIFLSTGHATLGEVESAMKVLWEAGCKDIALMHCSSLYPSPYDDVNLSAMKTLQQGFQVQVGYSDHTLGTAIPIGAVAMGACIIEKHFTDDKKRSGPDHSFALDPNEFNMMTTSIRQLEAAMGSGPKMPRPSEQLERIMARRAVYAKVNIPKGTEIKSDLIKIVRHAYPEGVSADRWDYLNGRQTGVEIKENELIRWDMIV